MAVGPFEKKAGVVRKDRCNLIRAGLQRAVVGGECFPCVEPGAQQRPKDRGYVGTSVQVSRSRIIYLHRKR